MNNATKYRQEVMTPEYEGKRVSFFINNVIDITDRNDTKKVFVKGGQYGGTFLNDALFDKFKIWLKTDKRFKL